MEVYYIVHYYEVFTNNSLSIALAFCITVGHTDCNECTSRADCGVTSNGVPLCECYSDCYEYGDCCSDISHVKNCVGEWFIDCSVWGIVCVILSDY